MKRWKKLKYRLKITIIIHSVDKEVLIQSRVKVRRTLFLNLFLIIYVVNFFFQEFAWDDPTQSLILSSFFWGYVATHIPGGMVAQRWGVHRLYTYAMGICGLSTILIPAAAHYGGWEIVCVCRVISGACQGIVPPVLHTLLSKWAPTEERGRLG